MTEDIFEQAVIQLFEQMGYEHIYAPDMDRVDYSSPILEDTLSNALARVNKGLPVAAINEALSALKNYDTGSLIQKNIELKILENKPIKWQINRKYSLKIAYSIGIITLNLNGEDYLFNFEEQFRSLVGLQVEDDLKNITLGLKLQ